jgi:hypothetical protein
LEVNALESAAAAVGGIAALGGRRSTANEGLLTIGGVIEALEEFQECVRYLNTRRNDGAMLALNSEADVQDALYLILRPWVRDLVPETPTEKVGNRYTIRDFHSRSLRLIIEAKIIRDAAHGKSVSKELHDDIEVYRHHSHCDTIIFFVHDPDSLIPDQRELKRTIEQARIYDGVSLICKLIVKP